MKKLILLWDIISLFACKKEEIKPSNSTPSSTTITGNYYRQFSEPAEPMEQGTVTLSLVGSQYYLTSPINSSNMPVMLSGKNMTIPQFTESGCITQGYGNLSNDSLYLNTTYSCGSISHSTLYIKQ